MTIYIIILNYKTKEETLACVRSVKKSQLPSDITKKILVVDNASGDGIERALAAQHKDVQFIQTGANLGYTGGNNAGIRWILEKYTSTKSKDDFILVLNNDTYLKEDCLAELYKAAKRHPNAGILSPKIYFTPNSNPTHILDENNQSYSLKSEENVIWYAGGNFDWDNIIGAHRGVDQVDHNQLNQESQVDYSTGCALFVPVTVMQKIHGFDEKYFMYYEDVDFCQKIKKNNYEIWYIPQAILWHENAHSSGVGSPLQDYFTTRNRLLFAFKYAKLRTKFAVLRQALTFRDNAVKFKAVKDFLLLRFGKGTFFDKNV